MQNMYTDDQIKGARDNAELVHGHINATVGELSTFLNELPADERIVGWHKLVDHPFFDPARERYGVPFIDALLDHVQNSMQTSYEPCSYQKIQAGDIVKVETPAGIIEFKSPVKITFIGSTYITICFEDRSKWIAKIHDTKFSRVTKPIIHPNPNEHTIIMVSDLEWLEIEEPFLAISYNGRYISNSSQLGEFNLAPKEITGWNVSDPIPM